MNGILLLSFGLLPLVVGPLIALGADRSTSARSVMDGFVAVSVGGIVLFYLWPATYGTAGWLALLAGLAGFAIPFLFHRHMHAGPAHQERASIPLLWIAFLGLAGHAGLDGAALYTPLLEGAAEAPNADLLALAVVLHRLPMAIALWWLVLPSLGRRAAIVLLAAMGVATVAGFLLARALLPALSSPVLAMFEAGVAGMLLHIIFGHRHGHAPRSHGILRWTYAAGALAGVAVLLGLRQVGG